MSRTAPYLLAAALAACAAPTTDAPDGGDLPDAAAADGAPSPEGGADDWVLRWSDEFAGADGSGPDPGKWLLETGGGGWGNGELQNYTRRPDNAVIEGGKLVITARRESYLGSQYTSARMKTAGKLAFTYGRVEMSAQLPQGQGIWPAFWMLGANIDAGTAWPACGELDIMEYVGKTPTRVYGTLHGPGYSGGGGIGASYEAGAAISAGQHRYAVEWEPDVVRWYFDDELFQQRTPADLTGRRWVFDHDFFVLLNLAVGGAFPGPPDNGTVFPQRYQIDYVRVYQRRGGPR